MEGTALPKNYSAVIPGRVSIDERPNIVEAKSHVGGWEGDTVESAGKNAYIAAFVDRKMKLLLDKTMPDEAAAALNKTAVRAFKSIPFSAARFF
jgi:IS30 family transposase